MSLIPNQILKGSALVIAALLLTFLGCSKDNVAPAPEDTVPTTGPKKESIPDAYFGVDTTTYSAKPNFSGTFSGKMHIRQAQHYAEVPVKVVFTGKDYKCDLGYGAFEVKSDRVINFRDSGYYQGIIDGNTVLNASYRYFAKGDSLIMTKDITDKGQAFGKDHYYQYRLKRETPIN